MNRFIFSLLCLLCVFIVTISFHFFKFQTLNKNNRWNKQFNSHLQSKNSFPSLIIYDSVYRNLGTSSIKLCMLNDEASKVEYSDDIFEDENNNEDISDDIIEEIMIYELKGLTSGKMFIGYTVVSLEQQRVVLNRKLKYYQNGSSNVNLSVFEIIANEEYSISSLKLMSNVTKFTVNSEKRKIIEKYRNENNTIVVNKRRPVISNEESMDYDQQYMRNLRFHNETSIYELKGLVTNKVYIGSTT